MKTQHDEFVDQLQDLLDQGITEPTPELAERMNSEPELRAVWEDLLLIHRLAAEPDEEFEGLGEDFTERVLMAIEPEESAKVLNQWPIWAVAATFLAIIGLSFLGGSTKPNQNATTPQVANSTALPRISAQFASWKSLDVLPDTRQAATEVTKEIGDFGRTALSSLSSLKKVVQSAPEVAPTPVQPS